MGVSIGFIGTGTITSALVTGFCGPGDLDHRIFLSPRNAQRSAALAEAYPNVTVARSNQEVLDRSEWVVLAVVPKYGEEIVRPLVFRPEHRVINLLADRKLPEIAGWIGPTRTLVHMVPLPFAAKRTGPIAIYPGDREVAALFAPLGEIVAVDEVAQIQALAAITALMSSYYNLLNEVVKWGEGQGLSLKQSAGYTTSFFEALSFQARHTAAEELGQLAGEMTPGGLNAMAFQAIGEADGFQAWIRALVPVLARLKK